MPKSIMAVLLMTLLACLLLTLASPAFAYIGPGAGISVLGSLLSIFTTIVVAIGAILFWPLRLLLKRRKARRDSRNSIDAADKSTDALNKSDDTKADSQD